MKYASNKRYFFPRRFPIALLMLISGVFTAYIGLDKGILIPLIIGGLLIGVGLTMLVLAITCRFIKDSSLDKQLELYTADLKQRAMNHFNVAEEDVSAAEPILLTGYYFRPSKGAPSPATGESKLEPALIKIGKDNVPRANNCQALALLFGQDKLYWYDLRFSLVFAQDVVEEGVAVEYTSIASSIAEDAKLACITPKWRELLVFAKHLKVDCGDRLLEVWIPGEATAKAAEKIRGMVKEAKKRLK